jgi:hypothetical protein
MKLSVRLSVLRVLILSVLSILIFSVLSILILYKRSIRATVFDCDIAPLSLKIQNVSLADGIAVNRGIAVQLAENQTAGLRVTLTLNNTRIRNIFDCSYISANSSQLSACQGASGSVFDPQNPGFNCQNRSSWSFEVETVDDPPLGAQLEQGVARAHFDGGPSFNLPVEVWSSPGLVAIDKRSYLALGPESSVLKELIHSAHIPSRAFGLYYGSRSQLFPTDGSSSLESVSWDCVDPAS